MAKKEKHYRQRWTGTKKEAEPRKLYLIQKKLPHCYIIFDIGTGSGIYIPYLSQKAKHVVALDIGKKIEVIRKGYEFVLADAKNLPFRNGVCDVLWASEIVEHIESFEALNELERVTNKIILITMPNPLSPHFKMDTTHILKYSVTDLEKYFKNRSKTTSNSYIIRGLGFDEIPIPKILKMLTTFTTWFTPIISPTILVMGLKRNSKS
ncbi:MAG: class I SAM-dependent methyltransferase [Candidatus Freyarchaeota archaeon]|nr:class I SAM-dependent methyltransferase [Candidatus Jordarchaeia archaeon]MBS7270449.1 class I SAM-dependent methyltransferase [Candidatus Jordarchaeia archaeon]MBS7279957.1 class I SAM-dependent methyltransferase [Candidatus Jordarchaeia archaeon]